MNKVSFIKPNWPAPQTIKAYSTLRFGGTSKPPFHDFNLAMHVSDKIEYVEENRKRLKSMLHVPDEPIWITQTHSDRALPAVDESRYQEADATYTHQPNKVCAVLTADCLPILLCNQQGNFVSAIHAGWRGLANGILHKTLQLINEPSESLLAWLGPAIGPQRFVVGADVRDIFLEIGLDMTKAFAPTANGQWLGDLYTIARLQLEQNGIEAIYGGEYCTYSDQDKFFSYRRDGDLTGRMATLIWFKDSRNTD